MKICCFYNRNICTCGAHGWQPNQKKSTISQRPLEAGTFQFMSLFYIKTGNFLTRWVNFSFSRTLLHWEIIYCLFFNRKYSTYSAKVITTLQSTNVPHVTWYVVTNSGTNLQPSTSRHNKKCRQFRRTCHSVAEASPSWYWVTFHIKLHLTCNIRKPNSFYVSYWISMQLLKTIMNYHPLGKITKHFIRLQMEGTVSRCGR